jgi:FAD binding domain/Berberine and berberine like
LNPSSTIAAAASHELTALRAHLGIEVVTPADERWDEARLAWNLAVDQRPAAVAFPETAEQVASLVEFAAEHGLRVAPQGTGHNAAPLGSLADTLLLKTERMRELRIDPGARTARVGAGVLWAEVTSAAAEHGLAALAGSSPDVGVVGYTLGGGVSWMVRRHGLAASKVIAIEVATADGRVVRADGRSHPDLFWALRGGGGSFGVVTALEFELLPVAEVYAGMLAFPMERAGEVLQAWREWTATVPDEVTSIGRLLRVPPLPHIPELVRGRRLAVVEATILLDEPEAAALLEPLRALGPDIDTFATVPVAALQHLHMDPPGPVPGRSTAMLLDELSADAVDALVDVAGAGREVPLLSVELRHLGGAAAQMDLSHGAGGTIGAEFGMFAVGMAMTPEMAAAVDAYAPALRGALASCEAERTYMNFTEAPIGTEAMFGRADHERLREVKRRYDPTDVIRANHPIAPAQG